MIKSYLKFLLFICLFSIQAYSQKKDIQSGDPNDLDQKYIPDKNSILNSVNSSSSSSRGGRTELVKNIFKINLALLGRSAATVFWEHPFGKVVSVEAGLGLCYNRDYMQSVFSGAFADAFAGGTSTTQRYVTLPTMLTSSTYVGGPSIFLSGGVKLYFSDDAPEGSYFQFNMRYYANNLQLNEQGSATINGNSGFTVKNLGFNIIYGYQVIGGGKNVCLVNDFYMGFGLRKTSYDGFTIATGTNNFGSLQTYWIPDGTTQSALAPVFLIGYCLGFGF